MEKLFEPEFVEKLQRIIIKTRLVLGDGSLGNRKSKSKGSSVEFSDYREYAEGDDFRRLDWNAYGRFEKLFVKLFMEEREAPIHIFLDTSRSMNSGEPDKESFAARRLAAALSYISLVNYDKVSLIALSNRPKEKRLNLRGKNALNDALRFMEDLVYEGQTDILAACKQSEVRLSKGISIVISDFFTPGDLSEVITYLRYRKQEVYLCQVLSPQEVEPEINEAVRLLDVETDEYMDVTLSPQLLVAYRKVLKTFTRGIEEMALRHGVIYTRLQSDLAVEVMIKKLFMDGI